MAWKFNPFTANFDYYEVGGGIVIDGPFDFMDSSDMQFMDGNNIDFMST